MSLIGKIASKLTEEQLADYDTNNVEGGFADNQSLKDLSEKHGVPVKDLLKEMLKGMEIEMEHTEDEQVAAEISLDHLFENPQYYTYLEKMEKKMETETESEND